MTTGTTNLDILELSIASIEADEIASGAAAAGDVLTADGSGGASWQAPTGGGAPCLRYVALMTQSGESAPVPIILENTIGPIAWSYLGVGLYKGTLIGAFPAGRTWFMPDWISTPVDGGSSLHLYRSDEDTVWIETSYDGLLGYDPAAPTCIEIRVYP